MAALKFSCLKMKTNISAQQDVCEVFNEFFVNVVKDIGNSVDISHDFKSHPSIINITESSNDKDLHSCFFFTDLKALFQGS